MKKVAVMGGGFAGSTVAKKLQNYFNVTLIDGEDYFEFTPGILRTIVEPKHFEKIQVRHKNYLKNTKLIFGWVDEVGKDYVKLKDRKGRIKFDYLIIASGSSYNSPIKESSVIFASRVKHLKDSYEKICKAKRITIIGGGLVGIELMGELCTHYSDKKFRIIHSHPRLMERNTEKAGKYAERFFKRRGVDIVFDERIVGVKNGKLIAESGKKFDHELAFFTVGIKPNLEFMKKSFSYEIKNGIKVNEYLQMFGFNNIFVAGDVSDVKEEKTAQNSEKQAMVVVKNIMALENKVALKKYDSRKRLMVISLGKFNGIIEYKNFVLGGIIPAFLKWAIEKREMIKRGKFL